MVCNEPAPEGFPAELLPDLADFWNRGFTARQQPSEVHEGVQSMDLDGFAPPPSERPVDPEVDDRGKKTVARRSSARPTERIALQLCPERSDHHRYWKNAPTDFDEGASNTCALKTLGTLIDWRVVIFDNRVPRLTGA
jgi:hypothetical protein